MPILSARGGASANAYGWGASVSVPGSYESIATATGTGSSGTITFSSIPGTFKHLEIRGIARSSVSGITYDDIYLRVNSVSSGYTSHLLQGYASSTQTTGMTSGSQMSIFSATTGPSASSNMMGVSLIYIPDYANTSRNKTLWSWSGVELNTTSSAVSLSSAMYTSSSAITSIDILCLGGGSWTTATTFALYGIKESA